MTGEITSNRRDIVDEYQIFAARIERETEFLSGGFERHEDFEKVVALGEDIVPLLLDELTDEDTDGNALNPWWRLQAIGAIAETLGHCIFYSREISGRREPVIQATLRWGVQQGYIDGV